MLWWRAQSDGLGPLQRDFSHNCAKKPVWYPQVFLGSSGATPNVLGAPLAATPGQTWWQQCRAENEKQSTKPDWSLKPCPILPLPFAWGCHQSEHGAGKELADFGHRGRSGVQEGTQSTKVGEKKDELVMLNLMHFKISLWTSWQAGWWFEMCLRLPSAAKAIFSSSSGPVLLVIEENEQKRLRKA